MSGPAHWGNVFDRLADPATFTGVYAERFKSGPGINHDADVKLHSHRSGFEGSTNTGTDETIRDIRFITRPNLNRDRNDGSSPFARAAEKTRAKYDAAERALLQHLVSPHQPGGGQGPSVYVLPATGAGGGGPPSSSSSSTVAPGDSASQLRGGSGPGSPSGPHGQTVRTDSDKPIDTNVQLQLLFQYYCRFGRTGGGGEEADSLDSFNFAKFTRDCPDLLDRRLNPTEVDLVFVKSKTKHGRRLHYGQWLDALAALASIKYEHVEDPAQAFAMLLTAHVLTNPASVGIAQSVRSGLIRVETTATTWSLGGGDGGAGAGGGVGSPVGAGGPVDAQAVLSASSPSARARPLAAAAGPFSAAAAAAGISPRNRTRIVTGMGPASAAGSLFHQGPVPVSGMAGYAAPSSPASSGTGAGAGGGFAHGRASGGGSGGGVGGGVGGFPADMAPADLYEMIARKAIEIQQQASAAAGGGGAAVAVDPAAVAAAAAALGITLPPSGAPYPPGFTPVSSSVGGGVGGGVGVGGGAQPPTPPHGSRSAVYGGRGQGGGVGGMGGSPVPVAGNVIRTASPVFRSVAVAHHPHHPVNATLNSVGKGEVGGGMHQNVVSVLGSSSASSVVGGGGGGGGGGSSPSRSRSSPRRGQPSYGEPGFRPTMAGEDIAPGSVYDRLTNPEGYTGVYKRAFFTDGRINHFADTGVSMSPSGFKGSTNTGTNETIHDIRYLLRPGLNTGTGFKP